MKKSNSPKTKQKDEKKKEERENKKINTHIRKKENKYSYLWS